MQTLNLESRRYRRLSVRVPGRLRDENAAVDVRTRTVDLSTGGGAFEVPGGDTPCAVGDRVQVELELGTTDECFTSAGTVRHVTVLAPKSGAPVTMRLGVQFREALLLSRVPSTNR